MPTTRSVLSNPLTPEQIAIAENLIARLTAIRERLFLLQAVWATTLSHDVVVEADQYRRVFHDLAAELRKIDPDAVDGLIAGHEALLLAEPTSKPTIPLAAQRWHELALEARSERTVPAKAKSEAYVPDGLQSLV